jgi:hypothetical protein
VLDQLGRLIDRLQYAVGSFDFYKQDHLGVLLPHLSEPCHRAQIRVEAHVDWPTGAEPPSIPNGAAAAAGAAEEEHTDIAVMHLAQTRAEAVVRYVLESDGKILARFLHPQGFVGGGSGSAEDVQLSPGRPGGDAAVATDFAELQAMQARVELRIMTKADVEEQLHLLHSRISGIPLGGTETGSNAGSNSGISSGEAGAVTESTVESIVLGKEVVKEMIASLGMEEDIVKEFGEGLLTKANTDKRQPTQAANGQLTLAQFVQFVCDRCDNTPRWGPVWSLMRVAKRFRKQCAWKAESRPIQKRFDSVVGEVRAKNKNLANKVLLDYYPYTWYTAYSRSSLACPRTSR